MHRPGWTALHYAADFGDLPLIAELRSAGADASARTADEFRLTAAELARRRGHEEAAAALGAEPEPEPGAKVEADSQQPPDSDCEANDEAGDAQSGSGGLAAQLEDTSRFEPRVSAAIRRWRQSNDCGIATVPLGSLTKEEFRSRYLHKEPVLLTNASELAHWPALRNWRWGSLLKDHGGASFTTSAIPYSKQYGLPHRKRTLKEFLEAAGEGPEPDCLFENKLQEDHPAILADFRTPKLFDGYRVHPYQWLVGAAGSGAPWHFHQDAWNALVHGAKRWFFRRPAEATLSTRHPVASVAARLAGETEGSDVVECTQPAGSVMYVPDSYSHLVLNLEGSVAVACEFYPHLDLPA